MWHKIDDFFRYKLPQGIKNLIRWFPIIWNDRDWDYAYLCILMETKLRQMSENFKNHGHTMGCDKHARQTLVCAEILKKLRDDEYMEKAQKIYGKNWPKYFEVAKKEDLEYLGKMIGKHFLNWWD